MTSIIAQKWFLERENHDLKDEIEALKRKMKLYEGWMKIHQALVSATCEEVDYKTAIESKKYYQHNDRYWLMPDNFSPTDALLKKRR